MRYGKKSKKLKEGGKLTVTNKSVKVDPPKGYHWMKAGKGSPKLMKHTGKFVKHKGASTTYNFAVQKKHSSK